MCDCTPVEILPSERATQGVKNDCALVYISTFQKVSECVPFSHTLTCRKHICALVGHRLKLRS